MFRERSWLGRLGSSANEYNIYLLQCSGKDLGWADLAPQPMSTTFTYSNILGKIKYNLGWADLVLSQLSKTFTYSNVQGKILLGRLGSSANEYNIYLLQCSGKDKLKSWLSRLGSSANKYNISYSNVQGKINCNLSLADLAP